MAPKMQCTKRWLQLTKQGVNPKKSVAYDTSGKEPEGSALDGQQMPLQGEFRSLGAGIRTTKLAGSGTLILGRIKEAVRTLGRVHGAQGGFARRAEVIATLSMPAGLHAVELADVADRDLARLDSAVLKTLWGTSRPCRAKEAVMIFLCPGHRIFPSMIGDYLRLTWLAERARVPGELQLLAQAVWEAGPTPRGPMGRALRVAHRLGWTPTQGWWEWRTPMQQQPLSFLQGSWGSLCHAIRDALRYGVSPERSCPETPPQNGFLETHWHRPQWAPYFYT
jgi:hypothetical protein